MGFSISNCILFFIFAFPHRIVQYLCRITSSVTCIKSRWNTDGKDAPDCKRAGYGCKVNWDCGLTSESKSNGSGD